MKPLDLLQTPKWVYEPLGIIDLDPCAGADTTIATRNLHPSRGECGLTSEWSGFVFCNPPFSEKEKWINKFISHGNGILLLPERGSAPWFGPLAEKSRFYWVMGKKINFVGGPTSNNLGTCLFLFGEDAVHRVLTSGLPGHLVSVLQYTPRRKA